MEATIYNKEGKSAGTITLPESVFNVAWNADLVHQVVTAMQANARTPIANTKGRSEVAGGGKKPWRQKGTGRARHGSSRSPIWRGGGVTHGPTNERDHSQKINKKMRVKALYSVLSKKLKDGEVLFVDAVDFAEPKTKDAVSLIKGVSQADGFATLATKRKNAAVIAVPTHEVATAKSFRNIGNVMLEEVRNLNPVDLLQYKYIVFVGPSESVKVLEGRGTVTRGAKAHA
jgi:large subunit ribosomal protein L4